jgi:hypothetical protein
MADAGTVTLFKEGRQQDFANDPALLRAAGQKGWLPKQGGQPSGGASPQKGGLPSSSPAGNFGSGFAQGANPFHMPPQGTPPIGGGGKIENAAANMLNIPEIIQRFKQHDSSGAAGMIAGTGAGAAMQVGGKALKGMGLGMRAAEDVTRASRAAKEGAGLSRELKVTPEASRFAERYIQPLREAIDEKMEPIHKALDGKAFAIPAPMQRMIRKMAKSEVPAVSKIAEELNGRTALDYQEAKGLFDHMGSIIHDEASKNWKPEIKAMQKMLDDEIDGIASKYGMSAPRKKLLQQYGRMKAIMNTVASGASTSESKVRPIADAISGVGPEANVGGVRVGFRTGSGKAMRVPKEASVEAQRLGRELGVTKGDLKVGPGKLEKTGGAMQGAGAGMDIGKLFRAVMTLMQTQGQGQQQQDPYAGRTAQ